MVSLNPSLEFPVGSCENMGRLNMASQWASLGVSASTLECNGVDGHLPSVTTIDLNLNAASNRLFGYLRLIAILVNSNKGAVYI